MNIGRLVRTYFDEEINTNENDCRRQFHIEYLASKYDIPPMALHSHVLHIS